MNDSLLLSKDLPSAVRLKPRVNARALYEDLARVAPGVWRPEEPFRFDGFFGSEIKVYHNGDWAGISLRSQGGSNERTDPGGPGLEDFADTAFMRSTPYIASLLRSWQVPLRSVRLLRLPPNGSIEEHRDTYHGFEYGQLRLHIPITTNPQAITYIRGEKWHWGAGEAWYGDFGSLHAVHNGGTSDRVHLVLDVLITPALLELFPDELAPALARTDVLFHEARDGESVRSVQALECEFHMPSTLVRGIFDIDDGIVGQMDCSLRMLGDSLVWRVDGRDVVRLEPLARNRLAFAGWTMERYFEYGLADGRVASLELVLRRGREESRIRFPSPRPLGR